MIILLLGSNECIMNWKKKDIFTHTILVTQFSFKFLQNAGKETNSICKFLDFVITK